MSLFWQLKRLWVHHLSPCINICLTINGLEISYPKRKKKRITYVFFFYQPTANSYLQANTFFCVLSKWRYACIAAVLEGAMVDMVSWMVNKRKKDFFVLFEGQVAWACVTCNAFLFFQWPWKAFIEKLFKGATDSQNSRGIYRKYLQVFAEYVALKKNCAILP